jgi:hypothetical protein
MLEHLFIIVLLIFKNCYAVDLAAGSCCTYVAIPDRVAAQSGVYFPLKIYQDIGVKESSVFCLFGSVFSGESCKL